MLSAVSARDSVRTKTETFERRTRRIDVGRFRRHVRGHVVTESTVVSEWALVFAHDRRAEARFARRSFLARSTLVASAKLRLFLLWTFWVFFFFFWFFFCEFLVRAIDVLSQESAQKTSWQSRESSLILDALLGFDSRFSSSLAIRRRSSHASFVRRHWRTSGPDNALSFALLLPTR